MELIDVYIEYSRPTTVTINFSTSKKWLYFRLFQVSALTRLGRQYHCATPSFSYAVLRVDTTLCPSNECYLLSYVDSILLRISDSSIHTRTQLNLNFNLIGLFLIFVCTTCAPFLFVWLFMIVVAFLHIPKWVYNRNICHRTEF